jgi:uncharacterized protein
MTLPQKEPKERKKNINNARPAVPRQIPLRTCVACRKQKSKRDLVRVVRSSLGVIEVDATGKKDGRGVYFCPARECLEKALSGKLLEHTFKENITQREQLDRGIQELLKELIA